MTQKVRYTDLLPQEYAERLAAAPIAYLPLGTLEWHGEHLPLGSDGLQSAGLFERLAETVGGIVLPMLFVGPDKRKVRKGIEYVGMDIEGFPGSAPRQLPGSAYYVSDRQFVRLFDEIIRMLRRAGFRILVAHGHGPSTILFRRHAPKWERKYRIRLFDCWYHGETDPMGFMVDHAGANETSLMMELHPTLVHMDLAPSPPRSLTAVAGRDPRTHASREHGKEVVDLTFTKVSELLRDALEKVSPSPDVHLPRH